MGPNYSISTACTTSNSCIISAAGHILRGEAVRTRPFLELLCFTFLNKSIVPLNSICSGLVVSASGHDALWWIRFSDNSFRYEYIEQHFPFDALCKIYKGIGETGLAGFVACKVLSRRNDDPTKASRPWDKVYFLSSSFRFCFFASY